MGRQRNNPQMKGKEEASERMLNEIEASPLSDMSSNKWLSGTHWAHREQPETTGKLHELTAN